MKKYSTLIQVIIILLISVIYIGSTPARETLNGFDLNKFNPTNEVSIFDIINRVIFLLFIVPLFYIIKNSFFGDKGTINKQSSHYILRFIGKVLVLILSLSLISMIVKIIFGCMC